jgi:ABC-type Na+ efflux pump permease subunit
METDQHQSSSLFSLNLDAQNSYTLRSVASWAKVLGVVGIILGVVFVLMGIMIQDQTSTYRYRTENSEAYGMVGYVIMAIIQITSSIFALNGGNKLSVALRANDQASLNSGFAMVRNFFAIWAILLILSVLVMIIALMARI